LLLATDDYGRTICHLAAEWGTFEVLEKVWEWATEKLTTEEINNKLLLAVDHNGRTLWHLAGKWCNLEALERLRE